MTEVQTVRDKLTEQGKALHLAARQFQATVLALRELGADADTIANLCASLDVTLSQWLSRKETDGPE